MQEKSKLRNFTECILIVALFYVTGGAFSYSNYSLQITLFFLISLAVCCICGEAHKLKRKTVFVPWIMMSFFLLIVPLLFDDSIATYLAIIMQLSIGAFCASIISPHDFIDKYIGIIIFFAAISLLGFTAGMIWPNVATWFPLIIGEESVDYYNAFVYVFMRAKGYRSLVLMTRNAGICWEPGCYQMFLNVGLLFLLERQKVCEQRFFLIKFLVLSITIITTMSTSGIFLMVLVIAANWRVWKKYGVGVLAILPICGAALAFATSYFSADAFLYKKIIREFGTGNVLWSRLSIDKIWYLFSKEGIPYLLGMSFSKWVEMNVSLWNSVIHSVLCLGIPFTTIQLIGYWKGTRILSNRRVLLFFIMIVSASTETLFWRVFFDTFAFYGWLYSPGSSMTGASNHDESPLPIPRRKGSIR